MVHEEPEDCVVTHDWFTWTTCSRYWFTQRELLLSSRVASVVRSEAVVCM